jgi:uncharacterized hydrophobic protein (TIGR00271 family)
MSEYVKAAVFIHDDAGQFYLKPLQENPQGVEIFLLHVDELPDNLDEYLSKADHIVVAASLAHLKRALRLAMVHDKSVGILPLPEQKTLTRIYALPTDQDRLLALALLSSARPIDLTICNERIMLFRGSVGKIPIFDSLEQHNRLKIFWLGMKSVFSLRLQPVTIETHGNNKTKTDTAAVGCLILEDTERSFASRIVAHDSTFEDGMISLVLIAPFSIVDYLKLLRKRLLPSRIGAAAESVGYIKSPEITIDSKRNLDVILDGEDTISLPAHFKTLPAAVKLNHGIPPDSDRLVGPGGKEKFSIGALPVGRELEKATHKRIPFFAYASEERFKDLFVALRDDGQVNSTYITLMVLSTILASVGLYLNSASVIIGAMLLAPLMAPIISFAMSLLRFDKKLFRKASLKIGIGVAIALMTATFLTLCSPYQPFTSEMQARLNPSVLDLIVAIVSGIAGAYTKSFKEILQSLAGVAIAVALVPPLAVAGIGLGRFDAYVFGQAFLLFSTNLIGIILAATLTFRVLGFSPIVRDKRSVGVVTIFFLALLVPLTIAFQGIIERAKFEKSWQHERFLVNDKYLIVQKAELQKFRDNNILLIWVHAREPLTRSDLTIFKEKVQRNIDVSVDIRVQFIYIP